MKPLLKINKKKNKDLSFLSLLLKEASKEINDPTLKFLKEHDNQNNDINKSDNFFLENNNYINTIITPYSSKNDHHITSKSFFSNNKTQYNKKQFSKTPRQQNHKFPLAIVELTDTKHKRIFLTDSLKKEKNENQNDYNSNSILRKSYILNNFYINYMKRRKQTDFIQTKLLRQRLFLRFYKYSSSFSNKDDFLTDENIEENKKIIETEKKENKKKTYNFFKKIFKKRLELGNMDLEKKHSNPIINSIHNYLYNNIMNYNNLIYLLYKLKGRFTSNFSKMISDFLSDKFNCFKMIRKTNEGPQKLIQLCELLRLEKYKKGEIIFDIDSYENKYLILLKGSVDVYERFFSKKKMKTSEFIHYLRKIKEKENNLIKLYVIIQKNIFEDTFENNFNIFEKNSYDDLLLDEKLDNLNTYEFLVEELHKSGNRIQGENINNYYTNDLNLSHSLNNPYKNYKKGILSQKTSIDEIKEFLMNDINRDYYRQNYSFKRYVCVEDCFLAAIDKDAFDKKVQELEGRLSGESDEMFLLYSFIFKDWEKDYINYIIKNIFKRVSLSIGEYLYRQNDMSDKIYIIIRGEFSQSISLNTKRIEEVKEYILFDKNTDVFSYWNDRIKKTVTKEEIDRYFKRVKKNYGDFPFEIKNKKNKNFQEEKEKFKNKINIFNFESYMKKKKEEEGINDIKKSNIKNFSKFDVLGIEEAIEGKHRFTNIKCESSKGDVLEINMTDFIFFCFHKSLNIDYLKEIIIKIKNLLIQKIEKLILVNQNSLINSINNSNEDKEDEENNDTKKSSESKVIHSVQKKTLLDDIPFDPIEIALNNLKNYKKIKLKEKYNFNRYKFTDNNNSTNRGIKNKIKFDDLFFNYYEDNNININNINDNKNKNKKIINDNFIHKIKTNSIIINKDNINNINEENKKIFENENNNNENKNKNKISNININKIRYYIDLKKNSNFENDIKMKSSSNFKKKILLEKFKIHNSSYSLNKNKNKNEKDEKADLRKKYFIAKKKLEESYLNREKLYYTKNFKNFPFIKYIYGNNKKDIFEETLYSKRSKDIIKQKKLREFLKKLKSPNKNILYSKEVIREAGFYTKTDGFGKIYERNKIKNYKKNKNYKINNKTDSYMSNDKGKNLYDLEVCYTKHIDFDNNKDFHSD